MIMRQVTNMQGSEVFIEGSSVLTPILRYVAVIWFDSHVLLLLLITFTQQHSYCKSMMGNLQKLD